MICAAAASRPTRTSLTSPGGTSPPHNYLAMRSSTLVTTRPFAMPCAPNYCSRSELFPVRVLLVVEALGEGGRSLDECKPRTGVPR